LPAPPDIETDDGQATSVPSRIAVVVLGMHRSGTSALTRALSLAGYALPLRLLPTTKDNADGYWEPSAMVALNDRLLAALGQDWTGVAPLPLSELGDDALASMRAEAVDVLRHDYGDAERFVVKDPRLARTIPFWEPVFRAVGARPHFAYLVRNPLEVARSLACRDGLGQTQGLLLWVDNALAALNATKHSPVAFVDFDRLLTQPSASVDDVFRRLGLPGLPETAEAAINAAIKPTLRHHCLPHAALTLAGHATAAAQPLYSLLHEASARPGPVPSVPPGLSETWQQVLDLLSPAETRSLLRSDATSRLTSPQTGPKDVQSPVYDGHLDCVVGTVLYGWCWRRQSSERVFLRFDLDDSRDAKRIVAAIFRPDLHDAGVGDGYHAFAIDLASPGADLSSDTVVCGMTLDGSYVLPGSGKTIAELLAG